MSDDGMDLLLGGAPAAKFPTVGTVIHGKVIAQKKRQARDMATGDLKFWDDGSPIEEIVFTLATDLRDPDNPDDDGTRRLFAGGQMLKAIGTALRRASWSRPLLGGELAVRYAADGTPSRRGFSPPKLYEAKFTPPSTADELEKMAGPDDTPAPEYDPGSEPFDESSVF